MDLIYRKLKEMQERPGMYLGRKSLTLLESYINGYLTRQFEIDNNYRSNFMNFGEYVRKYFNIHSNHGWLKIITFFSSTDEDAVDLFYIVLDKFLQENFEPEEIYHYQTAKTYYEHFPVREMHNTDHGNPKRFDNPHEHKIKCFPDKSYYFENLFSNLEESPLLYLHKSSQDRFESVEEFVYNLSRGGEIEFTFNDKKYSITHPDGKLCFIQIGAESTEKFFENIEELLNYEIDNQKIHDIVTKIQPYFRCF